MRRAGTVMTMLVGLTLAACGSGGDARPGHAPKPVYLDASVSRSSTITALNHRFCLSGQIRTIEDAAPYWVGLCRDRTTFEQAVFFMVFDSGRQMHYYLDHYESCTADGHYLEGPAWFAMTTLASDADTLRRGGASPLNCPP